MMKIVIKSFLVIFLLITAFWLVMQVYHSALEKNRAAMTIQTLNHNYFNSLGGEKIYLDGFNPDQPTIIMYFHPECEHCQYEASEIGKQAAEFGKANMVLITPDDSIPRIDEFTMKYHLWEVDNLVILLDRAKAFKKYFGTTVVPSVFIYGPDKNLIKMYKGEIQMNAILGCINTH